MYPASDDANTAHNRVPSSVTGVGCKQRCSVSSTGIKTCFGMFRWLNDPLIWYYRRYRRFMACHIARMHVVGDVFVLLLWSDS